MLAEGQVIGSYRITRKLGEGGMGAVFAAVNPEIGRTAAIKVLHPQYAQNPQFATRFLNEAKAANAIDHPGVVEIYEFNRLPDGTTFIVMEYLAGESLAKRLLRGPLGHDTLRITRQIASVLAAAHAKNIVHRDLKPDNVIMVKDPEAPGGERAKVLDFGIAKLAEEQNLKTQAGSVLGTPAYMAPEQCKGASGVTDKSDVYALGVLMYEMLSGQIPFQGEGLGDIMIKHMTEEPPPLRQKQPSVAEPVAALVHRMLAKKPEDRPTMQEVIAETERLGAQRTGVMSALGETPVLSDSRPATLALDPGGGVRPQTLALGDSQGGAATTTVSAGQQGSPIPKPALIAGAVGLALVVGVGGFLLLRKPKVVTPQATLRPRIERKQTTPFPMVEQRKPSPVPVPAGMAYIPGGRFDLGSTDGEADMAFKLCQKRGTNCRLDAFLRETPRHAVVVQSLFLDQTEVTTEQFVSWLSGQKGLKADKKKQIWRGKELLLSAGDQSGVAVTGKKAVLSVREGAAKKPIAQVSWQAAKQYCEAVGKRLPSEAEWELAARGLIRRTFPWGEPHPKCGEVAFGRDPELPVTARCRNLESTPDAVGHASQDRTVDGVSDLGGNVSEWVSDVFLEHYAPCAGACRDPQVSDEPLASAGKKAKKGPPVLRVVRGGHFNQSMDGCRSAGRSRFPADTTIATLGFRCAKSLR